MVGDIVGSVGRGIFARMVARLKDEGNADIVVANAENAAGGKGLTGPLAEELFAAGADVLTMGDHTWDRKELEAYMRTEDRVIRPANFQPGCPGKGFITFDSGLGPITVVNLIGRVFMKAYDCPFRAMDALLADGSLGNGIILVDIHAEATSECVVMGRYLDGRVTAVVGTHTHVQTSDDTILPKGTAFITDVGSTAAKDSAIGRDLESVTRMVLTGRPEAFKVATDDPALEGVIIDVERQSGKVNGIERVRRRDED